MTVADTGNRSQTVTKGEITGMAFRPSQNVEPTLREIVCWDFSLPFMIPQATSHAQLQLLNVPAATTTVTYMPNFDNTMQSVNLSICRMPFEATL